MAMTGHDLPLGTPLPGFRLPLGGMKGEWSTSEAAGRPLLVLFLCNHCPYVLHISAKLGELARKWQEQGIVVVGVNSNDPKTYPEDAPEKMPAEALRAGYTFPYLFDEDQSVAKAFRAACTPDIFLFDAEGKLYYHGQFDGARPKNDLPVTGADLDEAIQGLLAGRPAPSAVQACMGCSIKWRPGNEPA